jgi:hypothetical protein
MHKALGLIPNTEKKDQKTKQQQQKHLLNIFGYIYP